MDLVDLVLEDIFDFLRYHFILTHTSGITESWSIDYYQWRRFGSLLDLILSDMICD